MSDLLPAVRWNDALDILLVAAVVYRVLLLARGMRAVQMLAGVGVLLAVWLLARRLELYSLQWLLDNVWSFWAVALVVLFQPELRRVLVRIGQAPVIGRLLGGGEAEGARVAGELARAAEALAARRIGALVVVERAAGLRHYAELGVALDALVSADLLQSVFLPESPLHDGAVLVQGSRVLAAGCFLPLSRTVEVGRQLGTRHRAALGVSEETDAVAVVVSEETGRVSVAVEGRLEPQPDGEALRRRLAALVAGAPAPGAASLWRDVRRRLAGAGDRV